MLRTCRKAHFLTGIWPFSVVSGFFNTAEQLLAWLFALSGELHRINEFLLIPELFLGVKHWISLSIESAMVLFSGERSLPRVVLIIWEDRRYRSWFGSGCIAILGWDGHARSRNRAAAILPSHACQLWQLILRLRIPLPEPDMSLVSLPSLA